jgi:hypothetical protein
MWAPLFHESTPLIDAEAMLFVDDDKAKIAEADIVLDERVRADNNTHNTCGNRPFDRISL